MRSIAWNRINTVLLLLVLLVLAGAVAKGAFGGPLDPPGPPGSTMKTLEQVEARTPISSLPYTISSSGSYYLTGDLTGVAASDGITIEASDVTLDLNGLSLIGIADTGTGIVLNATNKVTILNGAVRSWRANGIDGVTPGVTVTDVRVWENNGTGIQVGDMAQLTRVSAVANGLNGISVAGSGGIVSDCLSTNNSGMGIVAVQADIRGCWVEFNQSDGIRVSSDSTVSDNSVIANGSYVGGSAVGVHAVFAGNRLEDNNVVGNDVGVKADSGGNVIARNSARQNSTAYDVAAGNAMGPVVNVAGVGTDTNPWSNISY